MSLNLDLNDKLNKFLNSRGPVLFNLKVPKDARVKPQVKFEDLMRMEPLLSRDIFKENMIVQTLDVSDEV